MQRLPRVVVTIGLPLLVIGIAGFFAASHALAGDQEPAVHTNWLRLHIDDVFTESPPFILAAIATGLASPPLAVLLVLTYGAFDLVAAATQPYELVPLPAALAGRLVGIWLLWVVAVEVPLLGRALATSIGRLGRSRLAVAAMAAGIVGGLTFAWTQVAAVLIRPVFIWSALPSGVRLEAIQPIQAGGLVFAVAAGAMAMLVAIARGPGRLLYPIERPAGPAALRRTSSAFLAVGQLARAALVTVALGGIIATPLDAVVLFVSLAAARPAGRYVARRTGLAVAMARIAPVVRMSVAAALLVVLTALTVGRGNPLGGVSEFFSIIAAFAVGLFVIEVLMATTHAASVAGRGAAASAAIGAVGGLALVAVGIVAPASVFADNCANFTDCWSTAALAALVAAAMPIMVWLATTDRIGDALTKHTMDQRARQLQKAEQAKHQPQPPPSPWDEGKWPETPAEREQREERNRRVAKENSEWAAGADARAANERAEQEKWR